VASDQDAAHDIDDLDEEEQHAVAVLLHREQDGLNVVLEEDARNFAVANLLALLGDSVLVGVDVAGADGVDSRDDGNVVLELVEVFWRRVDGQI
jgi:hypothetical protein